MSDTKQIIFHYTNGDVANVGDRVRFKKHYGYAGHCKMETEGVIKNLDHLYGQVQIDIAPASFNEDMGRFGTRQTSVFTIHANYDSSKGVAHTKDGRVYNYTICKPHDDWSLGMLCHFDEYIGKVQDQ